MNIACLPMNNQGNGKYRLGLPLEEIARGDPPKNTVFFIGWYVPMQRFAEVIADCDAVVFQGTHHPKMLEYMQDVAKDRNRVAVFEYDDNVFNPDPPTTAYARWGTRNIIIGDGPKKGQFLWEDGKNLNIEENKERLKMFGDSLAAADLITTTTKELAALFVRKAQERGKPKPQAAVLPNLIDIPKWEPVPVVKDDIRLAWSGGDAHYLDFAMVLPALKKVLEKYPRARLYMFGANWPTITGKFGKRVVIDDDWVDFEAHPYRLRSAGIDIGLCPLKKTDFTLYKSEVKYSEYSAMRVPTVASNVPPYAPVIQNGRTGLLAGTEKEWIDALSSLIENQQKRQSLGQAAYDWVKKERNLKTKAHLWEKAYQDALDQKTTKPRLS